MLCGARKVTLAVLCFPERGGQPNPEEPAESAAPELQLDLPVLLLQLRVLTCVALAPPLAAPPLAAFVVELELKSWRTLDLDAQ